MARHGGVVSRIAVMIPTRGRPEQFLDACRSVLSTSTVADVLAYVDDDEKELYASAVASATFIGRPFGSRVKMCYGKRIGPVAALNELAESNPYYAVYGILTDDSRMTAWGWDAWVLDAVAACPGRLAVVDPCHNLGDHVDMPFVSREWVDIVGWFACPEMYHYCWPIVTGLIGEMTAIVHAPKNSFEIFHSVLHPSNAEATDKDEHAFFRHVALVMPIAVEKLRGAITRMVRA